MRCCLWSIWRIMTTAIEIGLQGHSETLVEQEDTARAVGSGDLLVYGKR